MRFLHTADWHVGKTLRGRSRLPEIARALDEVVRLANDAEVDAVLVAGDIYDTATPSPDAERLVYETLARLRASSIPCVMIAGNHDHPRRLAAVAPLAEGLGLHIRTEVLAPRDGGVVSIPARDGSHVARILALPFVPERRATDAAGVMASEERAPRSYGQAVERAIAALARGLRKDSINILLAHALVTGGRAGTGERPLHLASAFSVGLQAVPRLVQYVALGHLHRPQELLAPVRAAYSGSLIELDFGEREQRKRVIVIEATPGAPPRLESIDLSAGRPLLDVEGTFDELAARAGQFGDAFLRVRVLTEGPQPSLGDRVRELLPGAVDVRLAVARGGDRQAASALAGLSPLELFERYHRARHGGAPPEGVLALFRQLHEDALQGQV